MIFATDRNSSLSYNCAAVAGNCLADCNTLKWARTYLLEQMSSLDSGDHNTHRPKSGESGRLQCSEMAFTVCCTGSKKISMPRSV